MKHSSLLNLSKVYLWVDLLLLNLSFALAYWFLAGVPKLSSDHLYLNLLLSSNLLWIICIYFIGPYKFNQPSYSSYQHFAKLFIAICVHLLLMQALLNASNAYVGFDQKLIFTSAEIFIGLCLIAHLLIVLTTQIILRSGYNLKRYAVVGKGDLSASVSHFYQNRAKSGYHFCGIFEMTSETPQLANLENFMESERLDYIYCCLSEMNSDQVESVIRLAERKKTQVRLIPDFHGYAAKKINFEPNESYPIISVDTKPLSSPSEQFAKRAFDLIFSSIIMILGFPVFLLIMLAVKLSSKGTVFFVQERTGRWGETFKIIKFRTMRMDAHKFGLKHSQGANDPRMTPIGNVLRRSRLDELPQFLNVLKGEMSVVGPRPLHKYDVEMLMQEASHDFQKALTIRPGITSIGQIKVGYATNSTENLHRLRYDILYLNTYSLTTDLYLIWLTIQVILLGKGR
ncbi:exopolysaccharide biosynthesis polyprenyl glycosylphosphotransferase [Dyadobacter sp. CY326]|uniref:exopolysaccharide biosynthesis polyprenyl glycosylphosphotransferase n=1 Tax=Dyadobacter sp. CY326 TaxID=2907300 RepID=UPI001F33CD1E|nr:exopolysaccharide biosynthesis polyprenyl glycosylphosphotransferase [Dyadobacter sp. CY326]MCE7066600.1 exopolysaccharide biosynthesis polyprenyl glycosylphosphotransferase [Dyadobacter sp. CY326]